MTLQGVDYSFGRPGGAALAASGKAFAFRYVPYPGDGGKGLTPAETADLLGHGISIGLVFEAGKSRALLGKPAGRQDAQTCLNAIAALGFPADRPIYFAVDFDASRAQQPLIDAYLTGAAQLLGADRVGVYGSVDVVERCAENSSARWFWQTYAWSGGLVSGKAHVLQYRNGQSINGAAVDLDRSLQGDFGVWTPLPDSSTEPDMEWTNYIAKGEDWHPSVRPDASDTPVRLVADRAAPIAARLTGTIRTIGQFTRDGQDWRITRLADGRTGFLIRGDLVPLVPGGDPTVDQPFLAYTQRTLVDCASQVADARAAEHEAVRAAAIKAAEAL